MIRLTNRLFDTHPVATHCPGPLHNGWHFFAEAVLGCPVEARPPQESFTLLTWNTGDRPEKPNGLIEKCAARHGCSIQVLGEGCTWSGQLKLASTADALRHITTEYVIGLDSGDVLLVDHPDRIVERFRTHFSCDLLFNATGSECWPAAPEFIMFESSLPDAAWSHGRCWLNAGAWVGRTEFCRQYFAALATQQPHPHFDDDQSAVKLSWPDWYPRIQIDYRSQIFQWFNEDRAILQIERPRADRQIQLVEWLRNLQSLQFGVEVGVFDGTTSDAALLEFPELSLWMVDPWKQSDAIPEMAGLTTADFEQARQKALWWTSHAASRRFEMRLDSIPASTLFPDQSLCFAFIDGAHDYQSVLADLQAWWPKIRHHGMLCGHDYGVYGDADGTWGVRRAVDEFAASQTLNVVTGRDGMWRLQPAE
ncbi:MAG: class I SAM-dependent methyltransferase [Rhodopirellula sp.]|nr:class I SAM-dependent methyltransferase [Rhodopirellula sp.]